MNSRWGTIFLSLTAVCVLLVTCTRAPGQAVNATLLGTVTDSTGAVVPGAKVTITEMKTGVGRSSTTNGSGNYTFPDLPPGQYQVAVEQTGFMKATRSDVDVVVNSAVRVDLKLVPGATTQIFVVSEEMPILQTDRSDVSEKIDTRQVTDLPLGTNRSFQNLLDTVPGTTRAHRVHSVFFNAAESLSVEVNGQGRYFSSVAIEGVDDNHRTGLMQIYIPPAEAIQTVDVTTSNYSAEFGRAGGAVTNVILKSGGNQFHGAAYEFNKVSALAARPFFSHNPGQVVPSSTYNYYGGNFGGPIIKNKTFFFGDILRIDDLQGQFNTVTLPTDPFRVGDFRTAGVNIYDPMTGLGDGTGRMQFMASSNSASPNYNPACLAPALACPNVIPLNRITTISNNVLALLPHTNLPGLSQNYTHPTSYVKHTTAFDIKIDHNQGESDRYAFRFSRAVEDPTQQPLFGLAGGPVGGGFQGTAVQHTQSGALNYTHIFSSTLIAETRIGVGHYRNIAHNADFGTKASDNVGITGVNVSPFTSGLTDIRLLNVIDPMVGYSPSMPWDRGETNINVVSIWTKVHGNHTIKWGGEVRRLRDNLLQAGNFGVRGRITFEPSTTALNLNPGSSKTDPLANSFAAFLIDAPTEVGREFANHSLSWRETEVFTFAQDQWSVGRKLTIDGGLRWELYFPPTPGFRGGYSNYDASNNTLALAGIGSNPLNLGRTTSYHYFAPRVGIAYRLTEKTVLRGGFGISYEQFPNNGYAGNYPLNENVSFTHSGFGQALKPDGSPATMAGGLPAPRPGAIPANGILAACPAPPAVSAVACNRPNEGYTTVDKNFRQPYLEAWNLAIQRALPHDFVLDVAYVGNHGVRVPMGYDLNAAVLPGVDANGKAINTCLVRPLCNLPGGPGFLRTGGNTFLFKPTTSNYNSLQVKLNHKWASGFLMTTSYTFGKALAYRTNYGPGDSSNDSGSPWNYLDFRRNYGIVSYSRAHTFVQSYVYELPFGKGKPFLQSGVASWIAGGWQVSGVLTLDSGRPLDFSSNGSTDPLLNAPGTSQTPNQIGPFRVLGGGIGPASTTATTWFDTTAFAKVTSPGVMGNLKRFAFAGPRLFNLDAALFRRFSLGERFGFELRAEAFSVTNTPQFNQPNTADITSKDFGHITGTIGGNRTMELGAKLTF